MYWHNPVHPFREQQILERLGIWFSETQSRRYLDLFKEIDPTSTGKYIAWLVKLWTTVPDRDLHIPRTISRSQARSLLITQAEVMEEDAEFLHELLQKFHYFRKQLPPDRRDILRHTKGSLALALKDFELPEETKSQLYERQIQEGQKLIQQDKDYRVLRITTSEAAREIAKGTAWCVSSLKVAADYIASGPLVLIQKFNGKQYEPFILAHHGYQRLQSHEEADPEYGVTSQINDTADVEVSPEVLKEMQPYLQNAFAEVKFHRMRKFADAWDLKMYNEESKEDALEQSHPFSYRSGRGQLEMDEEYLTRLIILSTTIFGGRDPWIEQRVIESASNPKPGGQRYLLNYIMEAHIIDESLEKHLTQPWAITAYLKWALDYLKYGPAGEKFDIESWFQIARRMDRID